MHFKTFFRPAIAIVFGFIGIFIAKVATPGEIFQVTGIYFSTIAFLAFAALGFMLPDILELAGRAGIAALAKQIADRIPTPASVSRMAFRRSVKKTKEAASPIVVDTSVLIDGRILEMARSGFLWGKLVVGSGVISELHNFSDSANELSRAKGRRGLDVLRELQKQKNIKVEVLKNQKSEKDVDNQLIDLCRKLKGRLMTVDFNLNKVSGVQGIEVLNINELANALKTAVLPSERLNILVSAKGKDAKQGVGYLDDGTMVVVEDGISFVGKKTDVLVRKVIQTNAGKMIFARLFKSK